MQEVLSNLPSAILLEDEQRNILLTNQRFCDLFNIPFTPAELQDYQSIDLVRQFIQPLVSRDFFRESHAIIKAQVPVKDEHIRLTDNRVLVRDYTPVKAGDGSDLHLWVMKDETVEIRAREEAEAKRLFYEDVLNNLPSDIAVFSPHHEYLFLNPVAIRDPELRKWMIGKTDEDYCRLKGKDLSIAETRKKIYENARASKKGIEWEELLVTRGGQEEYHLRRMSPIYNEQGEMKMLIGYGLNINERKKFEHQIQLSEKRYRDLFNYSKAIIFTHDLEGKLLTVNPALCERTGFTQDELIGKSLKQILYSEDHITFDAIYLKEFEMETKARGIFRILNRDGRKIYCLYENFKVSEKGEAPYIIGFAQDVTERIKAEEELKEAKRLTEETAKVKEVFLANMSHEIRTPMNGIIGISNMLEKTELQPEQKNYLKIINDSAKTLLNIINDVLDIEKISSGEVQIESIPFDLISTTNSLIRLFEYTGKEKNVDFVFNNQIGDYLPICGDPTRFSQVMNNLLSNAIKFTPKGAITVNALIREETEEDLTVEFSVQDTGIGIEEDKLIKIFKPYIQASPETARKYGGTGLGLAITKNLIELQKGSIWVQSKPNHGSKFTFTITYRKPGKDDIIPAETEDKPGKIELGKLKVLLAEDNQVNQMLALNILNYWGLECKTAMTGVEALQLAKEEDFDVILMDIQMPEKSGLEAAAEIRKLDDPKKRDTPIIALTAIALKGEEQKYIAVGMDDFLTKPFKEKALHDVISRVLKHEGAFGRAFAEREQTLAAVDVPETVPTSTVDKVYDMKNVNELARGSEDFVVTLTKIFIDTIPATVAEMKKAAEVQDWDTVSKMAHKIKPTLETMCIDSVKDDIRTLETDGRKKINLEALFPLVLKVEAVVNLATEQLKQEYSLT
ncbi:PAS domain S-box protein [Segetibacter sp. 3557_3]|uniref:PAS domain S-box protein n=1 Tax=Segetibacter sp. 3557_3 TaxID=2547429 RepID=UPI00105855E4|nr:PAS domain S-box protein [Segetibacter sp. 3557_3]TDH27878.1 PAS domain S-box protein [Segetibacter sp. 3557_3]